MQFRTKGVRALVVLVLGCTGVDVDTQRAGPARRSTHSSLIAKDSPFLGGDIVGSHLNRSHVHLPFPPDASFNPSTPISSPVKLSYGSFTAASLHSGWQGRTAPQNETVQGFKLVYQLPCDKRQSASCAPRGAAVLVHGCLHAASDWFSISPVLLHEERYVANSLLAKGFAIVAPDSRDPMNKCWPVQGSTVSGYTEEPLLLSKALQAFLQDKGLVGLPLLGVGSSTGGTILSHMAVLHQPLLPFEYVHMVVSQGDPVAWAALPSNCKTRFSFVHMPGDPYTRDIDKVVRVLREKNVKVFTKHACQKSLDQNFVHEQVGEIDTDLSSKMFNLMVEMHVVKRMKLKDCDGVVVDGTVIAPELIVRDGSQLDITISLVEMLRSNPVWTTTVVKWYHTLLEAFRVTAAMHSFAADHWDEAWQFYNNGDNHTGISDGLVKQPPIVHSFAIVPGYRKNASLAASNSSVPCTLLLDDCLQQGDQRVQESHGVAKHSSTRRIRNASARAIRKSHHVLLRHGKHNWPEGYTSEGAVLGSHRMDSSLGWLALPPQNPVQKAQYQRVREALAKIPQISSKEASDVSFNLKVPPGHYMGLVNGYLPGLRVRILSGNRILFRPEPAGLEKTADFVSWQATAATALTYLSGVLNRFDVPPVDFVMNLWDFCRDAKSAKVAVPRGMMLVASDGSATPGTPGIPGVEDTALPPLLSWNTRPECNAIATPMQDWLALSQNFTIGSTWRADAHVPVPWNMRQAKVVWRGAISSWDGSRARVLRLSLMYPQLIDAKIPGYNALGLSPPTDITCAGYLKDLESAKIAALSVNDCTGIIGDFQPIEKQMQYKFIIDLDGGSSTFRLKNLLLTGAVIFKVESQDSPSQFFYKDLEPMVHYVPVSFEFLETDLPKKIEEMTKNDDKAQEIAENAKRFAEEHLRWEDAQWHTHMVMSLLAAKQVTAPTEQEPSLDVPSTPLLPFCCDDLPQVAAPGLGGLLKEQCVDVQDDGVAGNACRSAGPSRATWLSATSVAAR